MSAGPESHPGAEESYRQALEFWFGRTNYEQRTPLPGDLKLDRMRSLLAALGNPQKRLRIVHVAGSKGKGSTSAMLASIFQRAGYRTGLFTSPHLCQVEERIQIDRQPISRRELTALLHEVKDHILHSRGNPISTDSSGIASATFFEVATAVGFLHFVRRRVDVAVVEVGLGGRFDSTNVCEPQVAVITSISLDHMQQLGSRLASIAMEKAGIVKPGHPTVSGATATEARPEIEAICHSRRSPLLQLERDFEYDYQPGRIERCGDRLEVARTPSFQVNFRGKAWPWFELGLLGEHQAANAAVAVACVEQLRRQDWNLPDAAVAAGLAGVQWPARMEVFSGAPPVVLDCAHNDASATALVDTLNDSFPPLRRVLVYASSNDKDVAGILRILAPHFESAIMTPYGLNPRSVPPAELQRLWQRVSKAPVQAVSASADALQAAMREAGSDGLVCITGSVFLAGELRPHLIARRAGGPLPDNCPPVHS